MSHLKAIAALAAVSAAVVAATGCGGSPDARSLFDRALSKSRPAPSGRLLRSLDARGAQSRGLPPRLLVSLGGPFRSGESPPPGYDMALLVATQDGKLRLRVIRFGSRSWLVVGETAYVLESGALRRLGGGRAGPLSAGSFGLDPAAWLSDPEADGEAELDGEKLVRIRATPDVPVLLGELDRLLGRAGETGAGQIAGLPGVQARAGSVESAEAVLLVGEGDRRLRRLTVEMELKGGGSLRFAYGVAQPGRQQVIGPPANPRPFSELTAALQVLAQRRAAGAGTR
ncbi:MAG: hypothetical protein ACKOK7_02315 [Solirubrobacterales bacterium]